VTASLSQGKKLPVGPDGFTDRDRELLTMLAKGFNLSEAAKRMEINQNTLRDSLRTIFQKLDASTQAEAVYRAVKEGVIK
jgi:LuxR family transcriptional regulator, maltose regulon positive regulatory protein